MEVISRYIKAQGDTTFFKGIKVERESYAHIDVAYLHCQGQVQLPNEFYETKKYNKKSIPYPLVSCKP